MKVKFNIINTWCIPMSEAVHVLSSMMMTVIVSEESLARGTHTYITHTHTHTHTRARARTHARTHTHTHTHTFYLQYISQSRSGL